MGKWKALMNQMRIEHIESTRRDAKYFLAGRTAYDQIISEITTSEWLKSVEHISFQGIEILYIPKFPADRLEVV